MNRGWIEHDSDFISVRDHRGFGAIMDRIT